jgi:hypothetical protein
MGFLTGFDSDFSHVQVGRREVVLVSDLSFRKKICHFFENFIPGFERKEEYVYYLTVD